jgi:hypothetical protein
MRRALGTIAFLCLTGAGCAQLNTQLHNVNTQLNNVATTARSYLPREGFFKDVASSVRSYLPPEGLIAGQEEHARQQQEFAERKASIEQKALNKEITWYRAAREVRHLHRRSSLDFDKADEEYHTYSAAVAEEVDAGKLTFAQYDALRTQRLNDLQRRRARP